MNRIERATRRNPMVALSAIGVTVVLWGLVSPLLKYASLSGPALSFYRLWIGAVMLSGALRAGGMRIDRPTMRWALPAGVIFGLNLVAFVMAVKLTTVANATLIGALQPAIVLLVAGRWFGETVGRREVTCVALAIAGVGVVIVGSSGTPEWNPAGDALALCAVLSYTAYFLVSKQARITVGTLEYMTVVHVVAAGVATPIALSQPRELFSFSLSDVLIVLVFALVSGTAGQLVMGWAHRFVDVSVSSLMTLGVPVVAALSAWALLHESLGRVQIAGGMITLVAIGAMLWRTPATQAAVVPDATEGVTEASVRVPDLSLR
jgi:drug/metabolite transporter (DMT)-like permease